MKSISILLLAAFVFSTGSPLFAQKGRTERPRAIKGIQFERTDALTEGTGVLVRWSMKPGELTSGFDVFRVTGDGLVRVNDRMVIGSMVKLRPELGDDYQLYDPVGVLGSAYVIDAIGLDQRRISSQPVGSRHVSDLEALTGVSPEVMARRGPKPKPVIEADKFEMTEELQEIVDAAMLEADLNEHFRVVGLPGVKIGIKQEGFYRVTRAQLQAAGFNVGADSTNWRLFHEGNEQAIIIGPSGDYIEFYGRGLDRQESDTRAYYLIADTVAGKRMETKVLRPVGGTTFSSHFRFAATKKDRLYYVPKIRNLEEENFFGRPIYSTLPAAPLDRFEFSLSGVDAGAAPAVVTVRVQGFQFGQHSVRVVLNDQEIGFIVGQHLDNISASFTVPASVLREGDNVMKLTADNSSDVLFLDRVTVSYSRRYAATQNRVGFFTPGYRRVDLGGFTTQNIRVFDVTEDGTPRLVVGLPVEQTGSTFTVKLPSSRPGVFYGVEDAAPLAPASIETNVPSSLSAATNRADMLIIAAPDLVAGAETWANYRRSSAGGNFVVRVANIADVIDEFNYGVYGSAAIRNFIQHASTTWQLPRPQYVMLVGDADYDPRRYEGQPAFNPVPTQFVELIFSETGSDDAMADFNNDGVAELAIGRIAVRNPAALTTVLNKTIAFETTAVQSLSRGAIFAFDRPISYDFEAMSATLKNELPASMQKTDVFRGAFTGSFDEGHAPLISAINSGKFLVNYSGHGASGTWASATFFSNDDVPALTNSNNQSVFTMLTCFNGYFLRTDADSLSELLLRSGAGGGVATWSSTTETTPVDQLTMGVRFYNRVGVAAPVMTRMGDLVRDAKTTIAGSDVAYSWALLGDPALKVR